MSQFHKKLFSQLAGNQPAHSPNIVPGALGPLALSRHGLSQDELLALMAQSVPAATAEALLGLKRELGEAVVETDGVWKFAHADGVEAAKELFASDQDAQDDLRIAMADYFEHRIDNYRVADEYVYQLQHSESCERMRQALLDIPRFKVLFSENPDDFLGYWQWLGEAGTLGDDYLRSFDSWASKQQNGNVVVHVANQLSFFLSRADYVGHAESLLTRTLAVLERVAGPDHPDVASTLNNLAVLYLSSGRIEQAEPAARRVAEILVATNVKVGKPHPYTTAALNNYAAILAGRGNSQSQIMEEIKAIVAPMGATVQLEPASPE